jgi:GTP-binding protein Era
MPEFHSGFVCFIGRPNTGKSTLTNALVGQKVAITSNRPQTTRHTIRGIVHREAFQIILVDTPGLHRPRTLLGKRLNDLVRDTYSEVDVIGLCIPADEAVGPGDRWIIEQIRMVAPKTTLVVVVTKIDKVSRDHVAAQLVAVGELAPEAEIVPVSAVTGEQVDVLIDVLSAALPVGPPFYPDGELTDEPEETLMAEFIREAALEGVRDELPHSLAVVIEEVERRDGRDDLIDVHAVLYVDRDFLKGIVICRGGARLREDGTAARTQFE